MKKMIMMVSVICMGLWAGNVNANITEEDTLGIKPLKLSGFRIGASYLLGAKADELKDALDDPKATPMLSQFGWQSEFRFPAGQDGLAAMVEFVGLVGGFNQGLLIPSLNVPIGIRSASGFELGAGPHISLGRMGEAPKVSSGFVVAGGVTKRFGRLNVPLNFAFMQGRTQGSREAGYSLSLLSGFAF